MTSKSAGLTRGHSSNRGCFADFVAAIMRLSQTGHEGRLRTQARLSYPTTHFSYRKLCLLQNIPANPPDR